MTENSNLESDFKQVTHKRKGKIPNNVHLKNYTSLSTENFNKDTAIRRINEAKEDISVSDLYSSILASLRESQSALLDPVIKEIICLGLGKIGECMTSRYQLGLLLCLRDLYKVDVSIYDPIHIESERSLLESLDCKILTKNLEGKHQVDKTTLFFLPHCPKQLSNNLLWANWGLRLNNCIIIGNSFMDIIERNPKKIIEDNAEYILNIFPYTLELAIINTFRYYDIFNHMAIHVFPYEKLNLLSSDFWAYRIEPNYTKSDLEFITNRLQDLNFCQD